MKVILTSNVKGSGKKGDVVNVSDGYAKNFLFPKKLALNATNQALNELKNEKESCAYKKELELQEALRLAEILKNKEIVIFLKAGESGKMYGSITNQDIACKIKEVYGVLVNKKKIHLRDEIKSFGKYDFSVKLYPEITVDMSLTVSEN